MSDNSAIEWTDNNELIEQFIDLGRYNWFISKSYNRLHWAELTEEQTSFIPEYWSIPGLSDCHVGVPLRGFTFQVFSLEREQCVVLDAVARSAIRKGKDHQRTTTPAEQS